jgi:hypothetical protein
VFRDFEKIGAFDYVRVQFLMIAKKLIWKYQRVLTKKASVFQVATADTLLAKFHPS